MTNSYANMYPQGGYQPVRNNSGPSTLGMMTLGAVGGGAVGYFKNRYPIGKDGAVADSFAREVFDKNLNKNCSSDVKKYFKQCDHTINEYVEMPQELVNLTKEEVQNKYNDWKVIGFEPNKVTLYKEFDDMCGEHFKLKVEEGKIVIYQINKEGNQSIYEKTNISSEYLTQTDLISIENGGLDVYGKEELNKIIEDFE